MFSRIKKSVSRIKEEGLLKPYHYPFILYHAVALVLAMVLGVGLLVVADIHPWAQQTSQTATLARVWASWGQNNEGDLGDDTTTTSSDTSAPSSPLITSPQNNNYATGDFSVQGTADTDSIVTLFEGVTSKGTAKTGPDGSWIIKLSGVSEGQHTYTAKATKAGRPSGESSTLMVKVDNTKPAVGEVAPTSRATGVSRSTKVTAKFSEEMTSSTLTSSTVTLTDAQTKKQVPASVSYDTGTKTVTLTPTQSLTANKTYTASVTPGAKDLAGNGLAKAYTWYFTTGSQ